MNSENISTKLTLEQGFIEYKRQQKCHWTAEEVKCSEDIKDWESLNDGERFFIENILAFFAGSDGIVLENLVENFCCEVKIPEARYAYQAAMENIHCVMGDTRILTDKGYFPIKKLVGLIVKIWNGEEFTEVKPLYTGNSQIFKVELDNGMELKCTPDHKWLIQNSVEKIETKNLQVGDILQNYMIPIMHDLKDPDIFLNPYVHGFFCGDGSYEEKNPVIYLCGNKLSLLPYISVGCISQASGDIIKVFISPVINKEQFYVPINYSTETKLRWLEGYADADGISKPHTKDLEERSIIFTSLNINFLKNIQLLLTTFGIISDIELGEDRREIEFLPIVGAADMKIYNSKPIFVLHISSSSVNKLINLGFNPKRLKILFCAKKSINKPSIKIDKITLLSGIHKTYCFNEPKLGVGIFNGILTGQSEVYSLLIDTFVKNPKRKQELFDAVITIPAVKEKADWALKWMDKKRIFAERVVAFAVVEGVFFSGSFCSIFWLKSRGKMCSALGTSNEWISRDEGMHTDMAVLIFSKLLQKPTREVITNIFSEAVEIESKFITESLPCRLIGMNSDLMIKYIKFVADRLITQLGYEKIYKVTNPFPFMETLGLHNKSNFFENEETNYQSASHLNENYDGIFRINEDF